MFGSLFIGRWRCVHSIIRPLKHVTHSNLLQNTPLFSCTPSNVLMCSQSTPDLVLRMCDSRLFVAYECINDICHNWILNVLFHPENGPQAVFHRFFSPFKKGNKNGPRNRGKSKLEKFKWSVNYRGSHSARIRSVFSKKISVLLPANRCRSGAAIVIAQIKIHYTINKANPSRRRMTEQRRNRFGVFSNTNEMSPLVYLMNKNIREQTNNDNLMFSNMIVDCRVWSYLNR